jgi:hypothetical protein
MGLFTRADVLPPEEVSWIFDAWAWLDAALGGERNLRGELITPSDDHFPIGGCTDAELPGVLLDRIQRYTGTQHWPCRLAAQARGPRTWSQPGLVERVESRAPAGTFHVEEGARPVAVITYDPALVRSPEDLVATLAHELAHYVLSNVGVAPPGGWHLHELATDLAVVYLGLGIFAANAAFRFEQFQDGLAHGWSWSRLGYASQAHLAYALALCCRVRGVPPAQVREWLDRNPRGYFDQALRDLRRREPELEALGEIVDAAGDLPSRRVARALSRLERAPELWTSLPPAERLAQRLVARRLLHLDLHALGPEVDALARGERRWPKGEADQVHLACALCTALLVLGRDGSAPAARGLAALKRWLRPERPTPPDPELLEAGVALAALLGDTQAFEDLRGRWIRNLPEPGLDVYRGELVLLADGPAADPALLAAAAVRAWVADLEATGGASGAGVVPLLCGRLGSSPGLPGELLAGRLAALEAATLEIEAGTARERLLWAPVGLRGERGEEGTPVVTLELAVQGTGWIHGDLDPAEPLGGALMAALVHLLAPTGLRPEVDPRAVLRRARGGWWRPETRLDVVLHLRAGLQCEEEERRRLELRFGVALRGLGALVGTGPTPGRLICASG